MPDKDRRCLSNSRDDQPFCRRDAPGQPFCQSRVANRDEARNRTKSSPSRTLHWVDPVSASVMVTNYNGKFGSFLDDMRFVLMHEDGDKLKFVKACFGSKHDAALGAWKKGWQFFRSNGAAFPGSSNGQPHMPYIRCPEEREYLLRLSTLIVSLNNGCGFSSKVEVGTVLARLYDTLSFLQNWGRSGRDWDFERRMRTACLPVFDSWHNGQMFLVPPPSRISLCASVHKWRSSDEYRCRINIQSSFVLAYFCYPIVAEKNLFAAIWRIAVCDLSVLVIPFFLACARYSLCFRWTFDAKTCKRDASGAIIRWPSRALNLFDHHVLMRLFEDSSFEVVQTLLAFSSSQDIGWWVSSCILYRLTTEFLHQRHSWAFWWSYGAWLRMRYRWGVVTVGDSSKSSRHLVLGRRFSLWCRCVSGCALLREGSVARGSDPGGPATSSGYYVDVDGEASWDLASLNGADEPMDHTVLKSMFTELQEVCRRANVGVPWSMIDVVDLALRRVSAFVAGDVFSNDLRRRNAKIVKFQVRYDRPVAKLSRVSSDCDTWRLPAREPGIEAIHLKASLRTSKD